MTAPKRNKEEKGVDFEGGEAGKREIALKMAIRNQAAAQWIKDRATGQLNPTLPMTYNKTKYKSYLQQSLGIKEW